jgi:hypothetical protein
MGVTGGGEVLIIPQQGMLLIHILTERAGTVKPQTFTKLLEQVGRLPRRRKAVPPPRFELWYSTDWSACKQDLCSSTEPACRTRRQRHVDRISLPSIPGAAGTSCRIRRITIWAVYKS